MTCPRRTDRARLAGSLLAVAALVAPTVAADPAAAAVPTDPPVPSDPACVLAVVDGVPVTVADAEALRALLQPAPSEAGARRLAVDAALAWWDLHGWLAGSGPRGRLEAWRVWLAADPDAGADATVRDVAAVAARARLEPGPCAAEGATAPAASPAAQGEARLPSPSPRAESARERLAEESRGFATYPVRLLHVAAARTADVRGADGSALVPDGASWEAFADGFDAAGWTVHLGEIDAPARLLEPRLARAAAALAPGETAGPIEAADGIYWIERR